MFNKQQNYVLSGFSLTLGFIIEFVTIHFEHNIQFMRLLSQNVIVNSAQGEALGMFPPITDCSAHCWQPLLAVIAGKHCLQSLLAIIAGKLELKLAIKK